MTRFDSYATRLTVGDAAPDFHVRNSDGVAVALSQLWAHGPAVLVFLRHFG